MKIPKPIHISSRSIVNIAVFLLIALTIEACQKPIPTYKNRNLLPPDTVVIQDRLNKAYVGMPKQEFLNLFPEANYVETNNGIEAYQIRVEQKFYLEDDDRTSHEDYVYRGIVREGAGARRRPLRRSKSIYWFYLFDDKYLGIDARNRWPENPERTLRFGSSFP